MIEIPSGSDVADIIGTRGGFLQHRDERPDPVLRWAIDRINGTCLIFMNLFIRPF